MRSLNVLVLVFIVGLLSFLQACASNDSSPSDSSAGSGGTRRSVGIAGNKAGSGGPYSGGSTGKPAAGSGGSKSAASSGGGGPTTFGEDAPDDFRTVDTTVNANGTNTPHLYWFKGPASYNQNKNKAYPLVIYLHASGVDDEYILSSSPEEFQNLTGAHEAFVYIPKAPDGWSSDESCGVLTATINDLRNRFNVDATRLYIGGFSMGGSGSFSVASSFYKTTGIAFAAISRGAGASSYSEDQYSNISNSAVWIHVGGEDGDKLDKANESWDALKGVFKTIADGSGGKLVLKETSEIRASPKGADAQGLASGSYELKLTDFEDWENGGKLTGLVADVKTLMLNDTIVLRLSVYRGVGHQSTMNNNVDFVDWLFEQQLPTVP